NDALTKASDPKYIALVKELEEKAADASEKSPVAFTISELPRGWKFRLDEAEAKKPELDGLGGGAEGKTRKARWTETSADFVMTGTPDAPTKGNLIAAGALPEFREPIRKLEKDSQRARVSSLWLILSYLIATLGELCLSPVGLSM